MTKKLGLSSFETQSYQVFKKLIAFRKWTIQVSIINVRSNYHSSSYIQESSFFITNCVGCTIFNQIYELVPKFDLQQLKDIIGNRILDRAHKFG